MKSLAGSEAVRPDRNHAPPSGINQSAVRGELERILTSSVFRSSKRCSSFLKYVVERAMENGGLELKERIIGVDVFGRPSDYDTNTDHVVRSVAAEVRRRLAQYYQECEEPPEVRIELHPGSYVPELRVFPPKALTVEGSEEHSVEAAGDKPGFMERLMAGRRKYSLATAVLLLLALAIMAGARLFNPPSAFERFWSPILASNEPVSLCFGGGTQPPQPSDLSSLTLLDFERLPVRRMHVSDAVALAGLVGVLQGSGKSYRILNRSHLTSFRELQSGPFVLIGALNNEWTLRLTEPLRFGFGPWPGGARIVDRQNPSSNAWSLDFKTPILQLNRDYGIVARLRDPKTQQFTVIIGGIWSWGTLAAAEFVTREEHLKKLDALGPKGWEHKNVEIVISTDIIRTSPGPPNILAAHFW
ncbi:MAG: hypothetical protein K6T61_06325 [Bryobacteraceae bacterium]|nr:hypothetical protein [Bryobacteraceae bacterium]